MTYKIGIVVPVINNFKGFTDMVASIKTDLDYELIVIQQYREQVPLAKAWNQGARQTFENDCDFALVCNDDILFAPHCIDALVAEYERLEHANVIMVTPNNILAEVGDPYAIMAYEMPKDHEPQVSDHPNFSCFLIAPEFFEKIGYFDENFVPAWYEDNDSHRRATLAGLREISTTAAPMVHLGGVSTKMISNPDSGVSQAYYIEKWGGIPVSHPQDATKEHFATPYDDPKLTIKDWRGNPYEQA